MNFPENRRPFKFMCVLVQSTEGEAEQLKRQMEKVEKIGGVLRGKIEAKEEQKVNMEIEKREVRQQTLELEHG